MAQTATFFQVGPQDYPAPDWAGYHVRATSAATQPFPPASGDIKSIIIIKLDALGDYLLHTPFYAGLRAFYPQAQITLLCQEAVLPLAETNPAFNHVITVPEVIAQDQSASFLFAMGLQTHAATPFDLIIVPRWTEDWHYAGVMAQTLDALWRLSYAGNTTPQKAQYFPEHDDRFTHVIDDPRPVHEVWRGMQILHALGVPMPPAETIQQEFHITVADEKNLRDKLSARDFPRPWIALGIGASGDFKRWPAEQFGEVSAWVQRDLGGTIFILGHGEKDEVAARLITGENLVGKLSPRESGVLIGMCDAVVCNDSYVLHAAATMKTPIVEIVGHPADGNPASEHLPARFGPWGVPFAWLRPQSCVGLPSVIPDARGETKCITAVPAGNVFNALTEILRRWPK